MSLLVTSLLVAGGVLAGGLLARARRTGAPRPDAAEAGAPAPKVPAPRDPFEGFPCRTGDVVLRQGDEAWLAGALVLEEDAPVGALFVAPEAGGDRAIFARPKPSEEIAWLAPAGGVSLGASAEPPATLEHGGERFERKRRVPVRVVRVGAAAPDVGATAVFAEYASLGGERLIVVAGAKLLAFRGSVLGPGTFTLLPGGKAGADE